jgi:uncharacterized ParB-like nuclease family protein
MTKPVSDIAKPKTLKLRLESIRADLGTQMRPALDRAYVAELAELVQEGERLPPLEVFHDGQLYVLVDGFHRLAAYAKAGAREAECEVHEGSLRDALLRAAQVNERHGLRRDRETKRRAVMTLLQDEEWRQWSDREIARQCLVSHTFVAEVRRSLQPPTDPAPQVATLPPAAPPRPQPQARRGGDGKLYPVKKGRTEPREPGLEALEAAATKPLSVEALCGVVAAWLDEYWPDKPGRAVQAALDGEARVVASLESYLTGTRRAAYNWPDVLEACERVRSRLRPGAEEAARAIPQEPRDPARAVMGVSLEEARRAVEGLCLHLRQRGLAELGHDLEAAFGEAVRLLGLDGGTEAVGGRQAEGAP